MQNLEPRLAKRNVINTLLAIAIIIVLVLLVFLSPEPAQAVSVTTTPSSNTVTRSDSLNFTVTIIVQNTERVPIQNVYLRIFSDSGGTTQLTDSPYNSPRSMSLLSETPSGSYGYGTLYGYDTNVGYGYSFGTGYGYGGSVTLVYRCTVTTSNAWSTGTYYTRGDVYCGTHTFSSSMSSFRVTMPTGPGGGGGAAGPTPAPTPAPTATPVSTPQPTPVPTPLPTPLPTPVVTDISNVVSDEGIVLEKIQLSTTDNKATLEISAGTLALTEEGQPLEYIETVPVAAPPKPPKANIIGLAYDFKPNGATFTPPLTMTIKYDPISIPSGVAETDLVIAYFDTETNQWVELDCVVDTINNTITAQVKHLTLFAVLAPAPTPTPTPTPTATPVPPPPAAKLNVWVIIGPILGIILIALLAIMMIRRRKQQYYSFK